MRSCAFDSLLLGARYCHPKILSITDLTKNIKFTKKKSLNGNFLPEIGHFAPFLVGKELSLKDGLC